CRRQSNRAGTAQRELCAPLARRLLRHLLKLVNRKCNITSGIHSCSRWEEGPSKRLEVRPSARLGCHSRRLGKAGHEEVPTKCGTENLADSLFCEECSALESVGNRSLH